TTINKQLRTGHVSGQAKEITEWLDNAEIPEDVVLHRTSNGEYANIFAHSVVPGSIYIDKGFLSTTTDPNFNFKNGITFIINVPKGSRGAAISNTPQADGENEVLLQRNSIYRVKSISGTTLEVEMLPPDQQTHYSKVKKKE